MHGLPYSHGEAGTHWAVRLGRNTAARLHADQNIVRVSRESHCWLMKKNYFLSDSNKSIGLQFIYSAHSSQHVWFFSVVHSLRLPSPNAAGEYQSDHLVVSFDYCNWYLDGTKTSRHSLACKSWTWSRLCHSPSPSCVINHRSISYDFTRDPTTIKLQNKNIIITMRRSRRSHGESCITSSLNNSNSNHNHHLQQISLWPKYSCQTDEDREILLRAVFAAICRYM